MILFSESLTLTIGKGKGLSSSSRRVTEGWPFQYSLSPSLPFSVWVLQLLCSYFLTNWPWYPIRIPLCDNSSHCPTLLSERLVPAVRALYPNTGCHCQERLVTPGKERKWCKTSVNLPTAVPLAISVWHSAPSYLQAPEGVLEGPKGGSWPFCTHVTSQKYFIQKYQENLLGFFPRLLFIVNICHKIFTP